MQVFRTFWHLACAGMHRHGGMSCQSPKGGQVERKSNNRDGSPSCLRSIVKTALQKNCVVAELDKQ